MDIIVSSDAAGGNYVVNNFETEEWLNYTINVQSNGRYDIELRASSMFSDSAFHIEIDGVNVTGSIPVPNTGSWSAFQWVGKKSVSLTAGEHMLKIVTDRQYFNLNSIRVTATPTPSASTPFSGTPIAIPGTFEAEDFDLGGEGVAYHDNVAGNAGGQYRPAEDVDIIVSSDAAGGGYVVNNFETGEWLAYSVDVPAQGDYEIELRAATNWDFPNAAYHVEIDGFNASGSVVLPDTGGWNSFRWVGKRRLSLSAGRHVLKIVTDQQYFNLNSVRVLPSSLGTTRYEESAASYTGFWPTYGAEIGTFSGGTMRASNQATATASFTFTGTAVSWIGVKCNVCGIATVQIDGGAPSTVNTAGPAGSNLTSEPVFSASGLAPDVTHTLTITVAGATTSVQSLLSGTHVAVDAFDVTR